MSETSTTFDFGAGPIPAHRHPNGGGWVADTASVDPTAYVDPTARVYGDAHVAASAHIEAHVYVCGTAVVASHTHVLAGEYGGPTPRYVFGR